MGENYHSEALFRAAGGVGDSGGEFMRRDEMWRAGSAVPACMSYANMNLYYFNVYLYNISNKLFYAITSYEKITTD